MLVLPQTYYCSCAAEQISFGALNKWNPRVGRDNKEPQRPIPLFRLTAFLKTLRSKLSDLGFVVFPSPSLWPSFPIGVAEVGICTRPNAEARKRYEKRNNENAQNHTTGIRAFPINQNHKITKNRHRPPLYLPSSRQPSFQFGHAEHNRRGTGGPKWCDPRSFGVGARKRGRSAGGFVRAVFWSGPAGKTPKIAR